MKKALKGKVADKDLDFISRCCNARLNYKTPDQDMTSYWNNFMEKDARWAGGKIEKFVRGKLF